MKKHNSKPKKNLNNIEKKLSSILETQEEFSEYFLSRKGNFIHNLVKCSVESNTFKEAGNKISRALLELIEYDQCFIKLYDNEFNIYLDRICYQYKNNKLKSYDDKLSTEILSQLNINKSYIVEDIYKDKRENNHTKFLKNQNIKGEIIIPIYLKDQLIGIFVLLKENQKKLLSSNEVEFINFLIPIISSCLNSLYIEEKYNNKLKIGRAIQEIKQKIKHQNNQENIHEYILEKLFIEFDADKIIRITPKKNAEIELDGLTKLGKTHETLTLKNSSIDTNQSKRLMINNFNSEGLDTSLKEYLQTLNVKSFVLYPNILNIKSNKNYKNLGSILLVKEKEKMWSSETINLFKSLIDTIDLSLKEYAEKQKIEEDKKDFIATLAHDLKSPLLAEEKLLESILLEDSNTPLKFITPWLQEIIKNNKDLVSMISNLLSVYHYERSQFEINKNTFIFNTVIDESIEILKYLSNDKNITINLNIKNNELIKINGDKAALKRVISNILSNAIKYTKENGKININIQEKNNFILTKIKDQGPGISPEEAKEIFNPYKSRKSALGRGLGLYIAKKIVEAHDGSIWVESNERQEGSDFCFTLPINNK